MESTLCSRMAGYAGSNLQISITATWQELANNGDITFRVTDTTTYVPVVTLRSIEGDKLLRRLERGFTKTVNWNRPRVNFIAAAANANLDILLDASFQGINRLFLLAYPQKADGEGATEPRELF